MEARTLLVRIPDAPEDPLAAGFARIPWEIARAPGDRHTLLDRAVTVRVAFAGAAPGHGIVVSPPRGEAVRVLLVFADPPGARPLAARLERERLRELFFGEILPSATWRSTCSATGSRGRGCAIGSPSGAATTWSTGAGTGT